jgi:hypothetical protein
MAAKPRRNPADMSGWVGSALRKKTAAKEIATVATNKLNRPDSRILIGSFCDPRLTLMTALVCLLATGCNSRPKDPELEIREIVARMENYAERKQLSDLKGLVDDSFTAKGKYDKKKISALINYYFLRRKNIHVLSRIVDISFPTPDLASVKIIVGLAGKAFDSADQLRGVRADLVRFQLQFSHRGEWRLSRANWARLSLGDFTRSLGN